jgi:hypothetical protein
MTNMPTINIDALDPEARNFAKRIVTGKDNHLRASKPPIEYTIETRPAAITGAMHKYRVPNKTQGEAAYVWRMVAFAISPKQQHQCMPMTADFDLPQMGDAARQRAKELDAIADRIIAVVPKNQWHGVLRWGRALGIR